MKDWENLIKVYVITPNRGDLAFGAIGDEVDDETNPI
jgi:hypothetical protein